MNIVHRDMKPHNVMMMVDGRCKLADFGAAAKLNKMAESGTGTMGTPKYMPPEAARGEICKASDIWAVGIIIISLFESDVTYPLPATGSYSAHRFMYNLSIQHESVIPVVPEKQPADVVAMIRNCLRLDPNDRVSVEALRLEPFLIS